MMLFPTKTISRLVERRETDLMFPWIKEEVGPVWISLHVSELKKFPQAQKQNLLTNLTKEKHREK